MSALKSIVWIDHQEARILRVESEIVHASTIYAPEQGQMTEPVRDPEHQVDEADRFFHEVARALDLADEILVVGPSSAKLEFVKYMNRNDHAIDPRILGVETVNQSDDGRLMAFAKLYFKGRGAVEDNGSS